MGGRPVDTIRDVGCGTLERATSKTDKSERCDEDRSRTPVGNHGRSRQGPQHESHSHPRTKLDRGGFPAHRSGPKNQEWPRRSREARAASEDFWSSLHEIMTTWFESLGISKFEVQGILQVLTATKSAGYRQAVRDEEVKILTEIRQLETAQKVSGYAVASHGD